MLFSLNIAVTSFSCVLMAHVIFLVYFYIYQIDVQFLTLDYLAKHYVWDAVSTAEMQFSQFWRPEIWDMESTPLPVVKTFWVSRYQFHVRSIWWGVEEVLATDAYYLGYSPDTLPIPQGIMALYPWVHM